MEKSILLTDEDMKKLRHMLGAKEHRPKKDCGFRNHYAAGSDSVPSLERLVAAGIAFVGSRTCKPITITPPPKDAKPPGSTRPRRRVR